MLAVEYRFGVPSSVHRHAFVLIFGWFSRWVSTHRTLWKRRQHITCMCTSLRENDFNRVRMSTWMQPKAGHCCPVSAGACRVFMFAFPCAALNVLRLCCGHGLCVWLWSNGKWPCCSGHAFWLMQRQHNEFVESYPHSRSYARTLKYRMYSV